MANLERLAMQHAKWSRVKREAKSAASQAYCKRQSIEGLSPLHDAEDYLRAQEQENCIERVYRLVSDMNAEQPFDIQVNFDDVWQDELAGGNVCQQCIRIRELKRQRVEASRKLGQIRSAITKAGDHLLKVGEA